MATKSAKKEVKGVSKLVGKKLELYMNYEKRENRFDPSGKFTTNKKMHDIDFAYKVTECTKLEKPRKAKKKEQQQDKDKQTDKKNNKKSVTPKVTKNSRRVTLLREAERLADYASGIIDTMPIEQLSVIHRYRPNMPKVKDSIENGHVQNYSRHVGAALHQKEFIKFYIKEGMGTGNPKESKRLQQLSPRKEADESDDSKKNQKTQNGQMMPKKGILKTGKSPRQKSSNKHATLAPADAICEVRDDAHGTDADNEDNDTEYTDDFEDSEPNAIIVTVPTAPNASTSFSGATSLSDTDHQGDTDSCYTSDVNDGKSKDSDSRSERKSSLSSQDQREGNREQRNSKESNTKDSSSESAHQEDYSTRKSATGNRDEDRYFTSEASSESEAYTDDFETSCEEFMTSCSSRETIEKHHGRNRKKRMADRKNNNDSSAKADSSSKNEDSASLQTYTSVEHAVEVR